MVDIIREIIQKFGGRIAGTAAETQAQKWFASQLEKYCDAVQLEEIEASFTAKFESLKVFTTAYAVALALFWVSLPAATLLAVLNTILFVGHFLSYFDWLDGLFSKGKGLNVTGTIEPAGEVRRTVLVAGHMDSVYEFQWWYRFKEWGGYLTLLAGVLIAALPVFLGISWLLGDAPAPVWSQVIWFVFAALTPVQVVFFLIHDKNRVVDGAADNLSGVAIAYGVAGHFGKEGAPKLKHTRVVAVSFCAEEPGLKGSREFAKKHAHRLRQENAVLLNTDTVRLRSEITILLGESNCFVKFPGKLVHELDKAFRQTGIQPKKDWLQMGASDAVPLQRRGIPSVTVVGINTRKFDPCYHTRLDTLENLDPASLDSVRDAFVQLIENWDKELANE